MSEALAIQEPPSVAIMLQSALAQGVTKDNADALGKMMELYERMEAKQAEKDFNSAFVVLQQNTPVIVAQTVITNRGKYERFEDVMQVVGPLLQKNGFAVSFSQSADDKRITVTCHLRHISGHSEDTSFSVRYGGKADSDTQADCKASTTAKRNSLLQALNIVIRQDCLTDEHDPTMESDEKVTKTQAEEIQELVKAGRFNAKETLEWLEAKDYVDIPSARYEEAKKYLSSPPRKLDERNPDGTFKF